MIPAPISPEPSGPTTSALQGAAISTDPTAASASVQANANASQTTPTSFNSMEDLRKKSPELYRLTMQSLAWNICTEMRKSQARLKRIMKSHDP